MQNSEFKTQNGEAGMMDNGQKVNAREQRREDRKENPPLGIKTREPVRNRINIGSFLEQPVR
jgi:hypothetical protein